ncbi:MAG TPA: DUF554 domain-containing protein [Actinomycetota bacterium]|nr:DUF554 domain-containing protein [Actinomycetota bacterium]
MYGLGTVINFVTVALGTVVGVLVGDRLGEKTRETIMQGLGLVTLAVAVTSMEPLFDADDGLRRFIMLIIAMILGGILGEALQLERRLEGAGDAIRHRLARRGGDEIVTDRSNFIEGFVVASTVFCVGPLTIVGAIQDGLGDSIELLAIKSALDGFAAIGFASVYGWGVGASLVVLVVYQGGMTAAAALVEPLMTADVTAMLGAVGSLLVLGIGLRLLNIARVHVVSLMPALFIGPLIEGVYQAIR